jgi:hypothetical protein
VADLRQRVRQSIADSGSEHWSAAKRLAFREFSLFLKDELNIDDPADSSDEHVLWYLQHKFDSSQLGASTLSARASALTNARRDFGLPPLSESVEADKKRLLLSFAKQRPTGRAQQVPLSVRDLVQHVPRGDTFDEVLRRAVFGLRVVTMMRPAAPTTIRLSSVSDVRVQGRRVVSFHFRSKPAAARGIATDTNYVEFIDPASPNAWACPASALLRLVELIRSRASFLKKPVPDSVCVDAQLRPLSGEAVSRIVKDVMIDAGWLSTESKDLRRIASQNLRLWRSPTGATVPRDDVCLRGGWTTELSSVVHKHYSDFRLVSDNFADILLG